jgi:pimeloyl-ACP methyl ester carboxylesterase
MDQRNAGWSRRAIAPDHGWHTYAGDHLALMEHFGFERFYTLGGSIGSSYCLKLCEIAPQRITAAVLQNPIGLHPEFPNYFPESHAAWTTEQLAARSDLDRAAVESFASPPERRRRWQNPSAQALPMRHQTVVHDALPIPCSRSYRTLGTEKSTTPHPSAIHLTPYGCRLASMAVETAREEGCTSLEILDIEKCDLLIEGWRYRGTFSVPLDRNIQSNGGAGPSHCRPNKMVLGE